jgi:hypothetical protein
LIDAKLNHTYAALDQEKIEGAIGAASAVVGTIEKIQLIGGRIWSFIVANEAKTDIREASADALPVGVRSPEQLTGWKQPQIRAFNVTYSNLMNVEVVNFTYKVLYTYNGRYLTNVRIVPGKLRVLWGFKFDFEGGAMKAINVGTRRDPIAAVELIARWKAYNPINQMGNSETFFIRGDGDFQRLSDGVTPLP